MADRLDVLEIIRTMGVQYDDRLRKECTTLAEAGLRVTVSVLEDANTHDEGEVCPGVSYRSFPLTTRKIFHHKRGLALKLLEMYARFLGAILRRRPRTVWLHNMEMAGFVPTVWLLRKLGLVERLVWDHHELPPGSFFTRPVLRANFRRLLLMSDVVISANSERRDLLAERVGEDLRPRFGVIDNYVDAAFAALPVTPLPDDLSAWLDGEPYILAQGGANPDRYLWNLVEASLGIEEAKLVVVGPYLESELAQLRDRFGPSLDARIRFTGSVPQMELVRYIDHALASVVMYDHTTDNCRLCAPNRLYQAVNRGVPVVVGCNPPMAHLVNRYGCGVVLASDGRDARDLGAGLRAVVRDNAHFRERMGEAGGGVSWETQRQTLLDAAG